MPARRILNWKIFGWSFTSKKLHREWSYTCQTNDQLVSKKHTHTHIPLFFPPCCKTKHKLTACLSGWIISASMYVIIDSLFPATHLKSVCVLFLYFDWWTWLQLNLFMKEISGILPNNMNRATKKNDIFRTAFYSFLTFLQWFNELYDLPEMRDMRMVFKVFSKWSAVSVIFRLEPTKKMSYS